MAKGWRWTMLVAVAALAGGALAYLALRGPGDGAGAPGLALKPDDPGVVAEGRALYDTHCASCHGAELEGQPNWRSRDASGLLPAPPHDRTGHTWHHPDEVLFELTKYGPQRFAGEDYQSAMPAYEGVLSDDAIIAVLSFIKSTWPDDIRARQDAINRSAR